MNEVKLRCSDRRGFIDLVNRALKSIKVDYQLKQVNDTLVYQLGAISYAIGYNDSRGGFSWRKRVEKWIQSDYLVGFLAWENINNKAYNISLLTDVSKVSDLDGLTYLPLFPSYGDIYLVTDKAYCSSETTNEQQQEPKQMKSLFDKVLETNKNEALVAAKATAGKTANDFIQDKLYKSIPWYARFFTKKKEAKNNPIAKLVTANIAVTLSKHFGQGNEKLDYISEAMLSDAMISLSRDSEMLDRFIKELTETVSVPSDILKNFNQEQES